MQLGVLSFLPEFVYAAENGNFDVDTHCEIKIVKKAYRQ